MKKQVAFLVFALILSMQAWTQTSGITGDLTWELSNGTLIISGTGTMPNYTSTTMPWYSSISAIRSVVIGDSITSIGDYAFYNCSNITSITIPVSVGRYGAGDYIFDNCNNITSLTITGKGPMADYGSFFSAPWSSFMSSIQKIVIEDGVTSIGNEAFWYCTNLMSITLPEGITSIGYRAFFHCEILSSITMPESVINIGEDAFAYCGLLISVTIPKNVTNIGKGTFGSCNRLTSVTLPEGLVAIEESAFASCGSLISIAIPGSVTSIGKKAFSYCNSLKSVTLSNNITSIKESTFDQCTSLTSVVIPDGVTSVENYAFADCGNLISIHIPENVVNIGGGVFRNCKNLTSIILPKNLISIGKSTFLGCSSLTSVVIPEGITSIGSDAFNRCSSLASITIPASVSNIGSQAFSSCSSLTSITIPEGVTSIREYTFYRCSRLTSVTIPKSVINIERNAFNECSSLGSIIIPESVFNIGKSTFESCSNLASIVIPNNITNIGERVFYNCSSLSTVTLPESITRIEYRAFSDCSALSSIVIPASVTSIATYAFSGCSALKSITALNPVPVSINANVFSGVSDCVLIVADSAIDAYKKADVWKDFIISEGDYTITVSSNNNTFGSVHGSGLFPFGEEVSCSAIANEGYEFISWTSNGTVVSAENPYTFIVTGNTNLVANFEAVQIELFYVGLTVNNGAYGSVSGSGSYAKNTVATVRATPNPSYIFSNWTKDGVVVSSDSVYNFTVTENVILAANFTTVQVESFYVGLAVNNEAYGSVTGEGYYAENTIATVRAMSNQGYKFVDWTNNGSVVSTDVAYSFMVTENTALVANFTAIVDEEITVTPDTTTVTVTWKAVMDAESYTLTIYSNEDLTQIVCVLQFDADGKLLSISFAKGTKAEAFSFTVSSLKEGTTYYYTMISQNEEEEVISEKTGSFTTEGTSVGIPIVNTVSNIYPNPTTGKLTIDNGQLIIGKVEIFDINGKRLSTTNSPLSIIEVDLSGFANGVYLISVNNNVFKILKQ